MTTEKSTELVSGPRPVKVHRTASTTFDFPKVYLCLDDVAELARIVGTVSKHVSIKADGFSINDSSGLDELAARVGTTHFNELEIHGSDPSVMLRIGGFFGNRLYLHEESAATFGIESQVRRFLAGHERPRTHLAAVLWLVFMALGAREYLSGSDQASYVFLIALLGLITGPLLEKHFVFPTRVTTSRRAREPSFWARRKDELVIALISAVVSGGLAFLAGLMLAK